MSNPAAGLPVKTPVVAAIVVLSNALGNFSLSWGIKHRGPDTVLWIVLGIFLLTLWLFSRMALFSWADLTFVLPVTSIGYALAVMLGKVFLGEQISWERWAGTFLIVGGTALVSSTVPGTTGGRR